MPKKAAPKSMTDLSIGAEARQLLALLAEKSGSSPSAVLESAIRDKAMREKVTLPEQEIGNGTNVVLSDASAANRSAPIDLRPLAARAAAGDETATEEMKRIIAELRTTATVAPAKPPEALDPQWQDLLLSLAEQVRTAVPDEWTEEELQEQIAQAIAEVRASRAGVH
jgi:hypothetical protein